LTSRPDLLVFSHLHWDYVWQRPQHIMSRLSRDQKVWFVEEPEPAPDGQTRFVIRDRSPVTVVRLQVGAGPAAFGTGVDRAYERVLRELCTSPDVVTWLYTPLAHDLAARFQPLLRVYDVMDDLSAFKNAPAPMATAHRTALDTADLVFTGGPSLHRGVLARRTHDVYLFRSGVDLDHYATARRRGPRARPVAGYVGVLDERIDFGLVEGLAAALPDWDVELVGPVHPKIAGQPLPRAANLRYRGQAGYEQLPGLMAGFDVAIMPFARNEATRSISPTKTLEYFAAGLPVVSTSIRDVADDYGDVVRLADESGAFAAACRAALRDPAGAGMTDELLAPASWDHIGQQMNDLIGARLPVVPAGR
jgi:glycosyltransferase involved in cell wall biosynthesis